MLIDEYLPRYDVVQRHSIRVRATQAETYAAITATDFAGGPIIRVLFALRMLPGALLHGRSGLRALVQRRATPMTLASMEGGGFHRHWLVVRPGSGLIRHEMLRSIRRTAEQR